MLSVCSNYVPTYSAIINTMESKDFHPIQDIRREALELSGLTYERAFAIDEFKISGQVNEYFISRLLEKFYDRVYADPDDSFR